MTNRDPDLNKRVKEFIVHTEQPVVYQRCGAGGAWLSVDPEDIPFYRAKGQPLRALYVGPWKEPGK